MIQHFFDRVFCINLARRPDRLQQIKAELAKHDITDVEFIEGIDGKLLQIPAMLSRDAQPVSPGDVGCTLSHAKVVKLAKERGLRSCFVLEDDAVFADDFNAGFYQFIQQAITLPQFHMLYLGGNHDGGIEMLTPNVAKIFHTYTTHAFGYTDAMYDKLIAVLEPGNEKVDVGIATLHRKHNCYVSRPHLVWQRAGFSDILQCEQDYEHLRK